VIEIVLASHPISQLVYTSSYGKRIKLLAEVVGYVKVLIHEIPVFSGGEINKFVRRVAVANTYDEWSA